MSAGGTWRHGRPLGEAMLPGISNLVLYITLNLPPIDLKLFKSSVPQYFISLFFLSLRVSASIKQRIIFVITLVFLCS